MPDTLPNITVGKGQVVDLYAASGIAVGTQINVKMISSGSARLYSGASLSGKPDNSIGYRPLSQGTESINDAGDAGAFIWSSGGCVVNVKEVV